MRTSGSSDRNVGLLDNDCSPALISCQPVPNSRQKAPFCRYWQRAPPNWRGVEGLSDGATLDKMMARRKAENTEIRPGADRKHLTGREVERLIQATRGAHNEARDRCVILLMFRHGLRVSEACRLKLDQVDIDSRVIHVNRLKGGLSSDHRDCRRCWRSGGPRDPLRGERTSPRLQGGR